MKKKYFFYDEQSGKCNAFFMRDLVVNINKVLEVGKLELLLQDAENEAQEKSVKEIEYRVRPNGEMTIGEAPMGWNGQFKKLFKDILKSKMNKLTQLFFDGYRFYLDVKNKDQVVQDCQDIQLLTHAEMGPWLTTINYNDDILSPLYDMITMSIDWIDDGFESFRGVDSHDTTFLKVEGDKVIIYESFSDEEHMINRSEYPLKAFWDLSVRFHNQVTIPGKGKKEEFWQIAWDGKEFGLYVELS